MTVMNIKVGSGSVSADPVETWHYACRRRPLWLIDEPRLERCPRYPWDLDMTLCIGALAYEPVPAQFCIVLAFDYKVSNDAWGSESEYKFHKLSDRMVALFAGSPARAKELALMYRDYLATTDLKDATAREQLMEPYVAFKRRLANMYIGRKLAISYQDLLGHGEQWLGTQRWQKHLDAIERHDPKVHMVFAGFIGDRAVLFRLWDEVEECTNFAAIGTGATTAQPALHAREQRPITSLSTTLYNVYEAKKVGESSPEVGRRTKMLVLPRPKPEEQKMVIEFVTDSGEKHLQRLWRKHGPKPVKYPPVFPDGSFQAGRF